MLTYCSCIYTLAMRAAGQACEIGASIAQFPTNVREPEYDRMLMNELPLLERQVVILTSLVDDLLSSLPSEVRVAVGNANKIRRHLYWIDRRIGERLPLACAGDAADIAGQDIPDIVERFDRWYLLSSPLDAGLADGLSPLISTGELDSALRKAWVVFKTRMVDLFGVADHLDGHRLVDRLFTADGPTSDILSGSDREAYLNLFKGLYVLSRNPIGHNDIEVNPAEAEAVITLINSALVNITSARRSRP